MVAVVPASFRWRLLLLGLVALAARIAWVRMEPETGPVADESMWLTWGAQVLPSPEVAFSPLKLSFIFHPPLYLYLVGAASELFGGFSSVRYVQAVLGATLALSLGLIGRRLSGEATGLVAAAMAALYPELVWFVSHYWAETVFTVLLWWGMERLVAADADGSWRAAILGGGLFGLAVLTRETVLYFVPLAGLWLAFRRTGGRRRAALFVGTAALVVLPWTIRNWLVFDAFVPVSTAGALNLWQGNARLSRQEVYDQYRLVHGKVAQYENARRRGLEAVLERQPWWILEKLRDELPEYFALHGQPIVHLERGAYGEVPRPSAFAAIAVVLLPYLAVLVLFVAGVAYLPAGRTPVLLLGFLVFYVLLHVASHGYPRYRLPSLPVLFLVGAHGWVAWRSRPRPARRHLLAAALTAAVLALAVAPGLVVWASRPWPPPWFASAEPGDAGPALEPGEGR
jgi:4-amino-4-deoxy-L-arabinose transferase-like glycosyltransferase